MAQVTIYLDDETLKRMREAARREGMSMSAWLAGLVRERTRRSWPKEVAEFAGAWPDFPEAEQIREASGGDIPREPL